MGQAFEKCVITTIEIDREKYHSVQVQPTQISFSTFGLEDLKALQAALVRAVVAADIAIDQMRNGEVKP